MVILVCVGIVGVMFAVLFIFVRSNDKTIEREDEEQVTAIVTHKKYESSYVTMIAMNSCSVPQSHAARYLVTMSYEDVSITFNDKALYENVKEGDTMQMILYKAYDKDDNLVGRPELRFPE